MIRARVIAALVATLLAAPACDQDDIGSDCPEMEMPHTGFSSEGDVLRAEGVEVAEVNALFPCDSAICVATLGRGSYCSRRCQSSDGCPPAFTCRPIAEFGALAEETYCAWRQCAVDSDCGDDDAYGCKTVPELSLGETNSVKLCGRR